MNLQDKLIELAPYKVGCKIVDGYFLITIVFNPKWTIIKVEDPKIECDVSGDGVCYYCAPVEGNYFDKVFETIDEIIKYNLDLQKKVDLFQIKVKELQKIFAENELDVLETINFTFKKPKKKRIKSLQTVTEDKTTNVEANGTDETNSVVENDNIITNQTVVKEDIVQYNEKIIEDEDEEVKPMEIIER